MEETFSLTKMFVDAAPVGKGIMIVLAASSAWCWLLILEGIFSGLRLKWAVRRVRGGGMSDLLATVFSAGEEAARIVIPDERVGERRQRIEDAMHQEARDVATRVEGGLPNLAVISSVAPFVGLFGTVWGIMASFAGIAAAKDTSLAVVAPGISEALAATAIGLGAAIPASIGYTRIGAFIAHQTQGLSTLVERHAVTLVARSPLEQPLLKEAA